MSAQPQSARPLLADGISRTGLDKKSIKRAFLGHLFFLQSFQ